MDSEGAVQATLRGEEGSTITLRVTGYRPDHGRDALGGTIEVEFLEPPSRSFHAACPVVIPASDVAQFTEALAVMDRELSGEATLGLDPDYFQIRVVMAAGRVTIGGFVYTTAENMLRWEGVRADQTFMSGPLAQFSCIVETFPERRGAER